MTKTDLLSYPNLFEIYYIKLIKLYPPLALKNYLILETRRSAPSARMICAFV